MKDLVCPYCKKKMLKGQVESEHKLVWTQGKEKPSVLRNRVDDGQACVGYWMKIPRLSKWKSEAYLCPDCKVMVLEDVDTTKLRKENTFENTTCPFCEEHLLLGNMRPHNSKLIWCPENERQFLRRIVTKGRAVAGYYESQRLKWLYYWIVETYLCPQCRRMIIKDVDVSRL